MQVKNWLSFNTTTTQKNINFSIATMVEEIKPVFKEKHELEKDLSLLIALRYSCILMNPRQKTK